MASTNLGRVLIIPKGTWDSSLEYSRLNLVNYGGNSYVAKTDVPTGTAINNDYYWQLVASKGDTGGLGQVADTFNILTDYAVGDYCIYDGDLYRFTLSHPASDWDGTDVVLCSITDEIKKNRLLYFTNQVVSVANNAQIMRIPASGTDSRITPDTVLVNLQFGTPKMVAQIVNWTSYDGYMTFSGTCTTATSAIVVLGNKG